MSNRTVRSAVLAAAAARLSYAVAARQAAGRRQDLGPHEPSRRADHAARRARRLRSGASRARSLRGVSTRDRIALAVAGAGAAAFGSYDDLAGNGASKGFRGHLGALRKGELTTGAVKIAGIGATGLAAALIAGRPLARAAR